jgi:hypothetical protein
VALLVDVAPGAHWASRPPPAAPPWPLASPSRHRVRLRPRLRYPQLGAKVHPLTLAEPFALAIYFFLL